jgi:hypothetical protein
VNEFQERGGSGVAELERKSSQNIEKYAEKGGAWVYSLLYIVGVNVKFQGEAVGETDS